MDSFHGEANGMTVYKACEVVLENVRVDQIRAGSHLTHAQVNGLSSPDLVPRACGVDIRPNTNVWINQDMGIVKGNDISGFDTCYGKIDFDERGISMVSLVMILSLLAILLYVFAKILMEYLANNGVMKNMSEYTPLLDGKSQT